MDSPRRRAARTQAERRETARFQDLRLELADDPNVTAADLARLCQASGSKRRRSSRLGPASQVKSVPTLALAITVVVRFARKPDPAARGALAVAGFVWDPQLTGFVADASHRTKTTAALCESAHSAQVFIQARATI